MRDPGPAPPPRATPQARAHFRRFEPIGLRWHDNDIYGHVNNVVYYAWFDTAVNRMLIGLGLLDAQAGEIVGLVVETTCSYFDSVAFPEAVEIGIAISRLGRTSVTYDVGVFRPDSSVAAAQGRFVHVYVDRLTRRPVELPARWRDRLGPLLRG
jgi:acyl-CoA thioester hydrolase